MTNENPADFDCSTRPPGNMYLVGQFDIHPVDVLVILVDGGSPDGMSAATWIRSALCVKGGRKKLHAEEMLTVWL